MEESIIIYCQRRLGLDRWSDLRNLEIMPKFLDLILSEELTGMFPPIQYHYAANLINGSKTRMKDGDSVIIYLQKLQAAFAAFEGNAARRHA